MLLKWDAVAGERGGAGELRPGLRAECVDGIAAFRLKSEARAFPVSTPPQSDDCDLVQVIQDRLCAPRLAYSWLLALGASSITTRGYWESHEERWMSPRHPWLLPKESVGFAFVRTPSDSWSPWCAPPALTPLTSSWMWFLTRLTPVLLFRRSMYWKGHMWMSSCRRWGSCSNASFLQLA